MGYYTKFSLSVEEGSCNARDVAKYMLKEIADKEKFYPFEDCLEDIFEEISEGADLEFNGNGSWRKHEEEMVELSERYPNVVFKLHCEGEEQGDVWDKYFLNGFMQTRRAKVEIPPFDREELLSQQKRK